MPTAITSKMRVPVPDDTAGREPLLDLLLASAAAAYCPKRTARVRALLAAGGTDWDRWTALARREGLAPLVSMSLADTAPDLVPTQVREELRREWFASSTQCLALAAELIRALADLRHTGIAAVALKGPALSAQLYGSCTLRQYDDLDLLVSRRHWARAIQVFFSAGYRPVEHLGRSPGHELRLHNPDTGAILDLHRLLMPPWCGSPCAIEDLEGRTEEVLVCETPVETLEPSELLVFLCVHAAKHSWMGLKWLVDIDALLCRPQGLDWDYALREAIRRHCRRRLLVSLVLVREIFGAPVPDRVSQAAAADAAVMALADEVRHRLPAAFHSVERIRLQMSVQDRWRDRLRVLQELFAVAGSVTEADRQSLPLPAPIYSLHSLTRPFRLLWRYGPQLARQMTLRSFPLLRPRP